tara:strand:- start:280 stop:420 length:141 start_codon:yes stop_codon:yes gene_type:complete
MNLEVVLAESARNYSLAIASISTDRFASILASLLFSSGNEFLHVKR